MSTLGETQPRSTLVFDLAGQCLDNGLVYGVYWLFGGG